MPVMLPHRQRCVPECQRGIDYTMAFWFKTATKNVRLCEAKRYSSYNNRWSDHIVSLNQGKVRFQLAKRTKTSNRLGLDLGPSGGDATVAIDELRVFGRSLTSTEITKLAD